MNKKQHPIEVVPYDTNWPELFRHEEKLLTLIFKSHIVAIHHIGSTAVLNLSAKPTIDILLVVNDINAIDGFNNEMIEQGYEAWGEYGIEGRRFFLKGEEKRTHQVHAFQKESEHIQRHLDVRDYLIAHPEEVEQYAALKIKLAKQFAQDRRGYVEGKYDYVQALEKRAMVWATQFRQ